MRLRPLTLLRPKPLCPVGDRPLLDWALASLATATERIAVNVHHGAEAIEEHLSALHSERRPPVHISREEREPLGTAGAIGNLREWIDGRATLVVNADTWHRADLRDFVDTWDGERVRVLSSTPPPFGPRSGVIASLIPWSIASRLPAEPHGLWELVWRAELAEGRLDAQHTSALAIDCGTPADYLRANLAWSGGAPVIGEGAVVHGTVERSVVWADSHVGPSEHLVDAIRADRLTVLVR